ncbi:MAG: ATP-binding protein [Anaerolineae bacterium]
MNRLAARLTVGIVLTTLLVVAVVALLANMAASREFRRYLASSETTSDALLVPILTDYYDRTGSWSQVASELEDVSTSGNGRNGRGRGMMVLVADAAGKVVYSSQPTSAATLTREELAQAAPLVSRGQTVGYLLMQHGAGGQLGRSEQAFLDRINQGLLGAAALAIFVGVVVGALLARTLAAPLDQVATAAEALAAGDLSQRAPEQGTVETRDLARSFNQMAGNLEQAEQLRRNLLADVAHELRTPLTVIQGNLQALLDGVYPLERGEIATIYDETRLLSRLVADLRELAQAEAGQLPLTLRPTDVGEVLAQTVGSLAAFAQESGISLQLDVPATLPLALADPDRLAQVLRNLLTNALRYSGTGGWVRVRADALPDRVRVEVADNGPGIPPHELTTVFDRFWRGDRARSRDTGGSGLGLAITRQLVEAQGGEIGVTSDRGATFWFTLKFSEP